MRKADEKGWDCGGGVCTTVVGLRVCVHVKNNISCVCGHLEMRMAKQQLCLLVRARASFSHLGFLFPFRPLVSSPHIAKVLSAPTGTKTRPPLPPMSLRQAAEALLGGNWVCMLCNCNHKFRASGLEVCTYIFSGISRFATLFEGHVRLSNKA